MDLSNTKNGFYDDIAPITFAPLGGTVVLSVLTSVCGGDLSANEVLFFAVMLPPGLVLDCYGVAIDCAEDYGKSHTYYAEDRDWIEVRASLLQDSEDFYVTLLMDIDQSTKPGDYPILMYLLLGDREKDTSLGSTVWYLHVTEEKAMDGLRNHQMTSMKNFRRDIEVGFN